MANEHFFAVLSRESKVKGHTLVISRRHFSGIADNSLLDEGTEFKAAFFNMMTEIARKLTCLTGDKHFPKVYTMSICEHWTEEELDTAGKSCHTEHLHFHLLPRPKVMRIPYPYHPESMFMLPDRELSSEELEKTRNTILAKDIHPP